MTRFLYGDSSPSPLKHDFLAALDMFVTHGAKAVQIQRELDDMVVVAESDGKKRERSQALLENFHRELMKVISEATSQTEEVAVVQYGRQVSEQAVNIVERARSRVESAAGQAQANIKAEQTRRGDEIRRAVEAFAPKLNLPELDWRLSMKTSDGQCEMVATVANPESIVCRYALDVTQLTEWHQVRKVSELAPQLDLQVGIKKSWISRATQPELVHFDEFYISGFTVSGTELEIRLRKKPDLPDTFAFRLRRSSKGVAADVLRPGTEGPEAMTPLTEKSDIAQLERLWQAVRESVQPALSRKGRLISASLKDKDIFEEGLAVALVETVVSLIAPTVSEVQRHSPNPAELSLKREDDAGRREEIYYSRDKFVQKLRPLDREGRRVFEPLGLLPEGTPMSLIPPATAPGRSAASVRPAASVPPASTTPIASAPHTAPAPQTALQSPSNSPEGSPPAPHAVTSPYPGTSRPTPSGGTQAAPAVPPPPMNPRTRGPGSTAVIPAAPAMPTSASAPPPGRDEVDVKIDD